jgi:hypothetical protein
MALKDEVTMGFIKIGGIISLLVLIPHFSACDICLSRVVGFLIIYCNYRSVQQNDFVMRTSRLLS